MKVLLLGKPRAVTRLLEETAEDLRLAGHAVLILPYRNIRIKQSVERWLMSPAAGAPLATWIAHRMRWFAPDLVVAFGPLRWIPPLLFQHLARVPGRPPLVAWIGDRFTAEDVATAELFDLVAYSDTGLVALHQRLGARVPSAFVPLAASRRLFGGSRPVTRVPRLAFVATPTPKRLAFLAGVRAPVKLFGRGWGEAAALAHHPSDARRVRARELAEIYQSHLAVLNIRHEINVINGLNQRHFAPYVYGAPVVSDAQPDVAGCFEIGREMLVYQDAAELEALYAGLRADPARAAAIGAAGQRRVLAEHLYTHRIETIARMVDATSRATTTGTTAAALAGAPIGSPTGATRCGWA